MTIFEQALAQILGTNEADSLVGTSASEVIAGRRGIDQMWGRNGNDEMYGGSNGDFIRGESGDDVLYGGGGPRFVDMSQFSILQDYAGTVTFLNEGAGYKNALGLYKIADDGSVSDVEILFPNASKQGSGGDLIAGVSSVDVALTAGDQVGFFIVSNGFSKSTGPLLADETGSFDMRNLDGAPGNILRDSELQLFHTDGSGTETLIQSQYGSDLFHSAVDPETNAPNPDNFNHTVGKLNTLSGEVVLGFEDLKHGGDKDFDDTVFRFDIGQVNAENLAPNRVAPAVAVPDDDQIWGGRGNDEIYGMAGHDTLFGDDGHDALWGNSGEDILDGGRGRDTLKGGKGDDTLVGGTGADTLYGNSGDDVLTGGAGNDYLIGGSGTDWADYSEAQGSVKINLHAKKANGALGTDRLEGIENVFGGDYADRFKGDLRDNRFEGGDGNDWFRGLGGDDVFAGGAGNDIFYWRTKDIVRPSNGELSVDTILDFDGSDDKLDFSSLFSGGTIVDVGEWLMLEAIDNDTRISADFDGGGDGFVAVVTLQGITDMDLDDFFLQDAILI